MFNLFDKSSIYLGLIPDRDTWEYEIMEHGRDRIVCKMDTSI